MPEKIYSLSVYSWNWVGVTVPKTLGRTCSQLSLSKSNGGPSLLNERLYPILLVRAVEDSHVVARLRHTQFGVGCPQLFRRAASADWKVVGLPRPFKEDDLTHSARLPILDFKRDIIKQPESSVVAWRTDAPCKKWRPLILIEAPQLLSALAPPEEGPWQATTAWIVGGRSNCVIAMLGHIGSGHDLATGPGSTESEKCISLLE